MTVWTLIASSEMSSSPGSETWWQHLSGRMTRKGFAITICGFKVDRRGREVGDLVADPDYEPAHLADSDPVAVGAALQALGWNVSALSSCCDWIEGAPYAVLTLPPRSHAQNTPRAVRWPFTVRTL